MEKSSNLVRKPTHFSYEHGGLVSYLLNYESSQDLIDKT